MSHENLLTMNICRIANTNYSNSLVEIMMAGYKLSFCLRGSWTNRTLNSCDGRRTIFADNFSAAEIIFSKRWASKKCTNNFSGASFADFSVHFVGRKTQWTMMGQKGVQPYFGARSVFRTTPQCVKVQKRYSLLKSNRNSYETLDYDFYVCFKSTI